MKKVKEMLRFDNYIKIMIFISVILFSLIPLSDPDMFFHIKNGEYILNNGIPTFDPYSIHNGIVFMQHEWLSGIAFYLIYCIAGFTSLWVFKIIYVGIFFLTIYRILLKMTDDNKLISYITSGLIAIFCIAYYVIRPQLFSYLLFLLEIFLLESYEKTKNIKYLCGLPLAALLLINIHGAVMPLFFIFAFVYIFANGLNFIKIDKINSSNISKNENKRILLFVLISFLASLLNPYGINTYTYSFKAFSEQSVKYLSELKPLVISSGLGMVIFAIFFGMILTIFLTKGKVYIKQLLFIIGTFFMAFSSQRFTSYFIILGFMFFAEFLSSILMVNYLEQNEAYTKTFKEINITRNITFLIPFIIVLLAVIPKMGGTIMLEKYPTQVVEILKNEKDLKLFNDLNYGHFLIFNDIKVFVDTRAELYTKKMNDINVLEENIQALTLSRNPKDIFERYGFNYYIFQKERSLWWYFIDNPNYIKIFENEYYVLYKNK